MPLPNVPPNLGITRDGDFSGNNGETLPMSKQHTIAKTYTGGGTSPVSSSVTYSGESETDYNGPAAGSGTTTFGNPMVFNPATALQCCEFQADGNCTLTWDAQAGSDVTMALTANTPVIIENTTGTMAGVPSGSDTYTLKIVNAGTSSITFEGRMLYN